MENNPCKKEKEELEEAKALLQQQLADPLNLQDDNPEAYENRVKELQAMVKEKEHSLNRCIEKKRYLD